MAINGIIYYKYILNCDTFKVVKFGMSTMNTMSYIIELNTQEDASVSFVDFLNVWKKKKKKM